MHSPDMFKKKREVHLWGGSLLNQEEYDTYLTNFLWSTKLHTCHVTHIQSTQKEIQANFYFLVWVYDIIYRCCNPSVIGETDKGEETCKLHFFWKLEILYWNSDCICQSAPSKSLKSPNKHEHLPQKYKQW